MPAAAKTPAKKAPAKKSRFAKPTPTPIQDKVDAAAVADTARKQEAQRKPSRFKRTVEQVREALPNITVVATMEELDAIAKPRTDRVPLHTLPAGRIFHIPELGRQGRVIYHSVGSSTVEYNTTKERDVHATDDKGKRLTGEQARIVGTKVVEVTERSQWSLNTLVVPGPLPKGAKAAAEQPAAKQASKSVQQQPAPAPVRRANVAWPVEVAVPGRYVKKGLKLEKLGMVIKEVRTAGSGSTYICTGDAKTMARVMDWCFTASVPGKPKYYHWLIAHITAELMKVGVRVTSVKTGAKDAQKAVHTVDGVCASA